MNIDPKNRLLSISTNLARIPSLFWAITYIFVILIFAVAFMLNSDGFYHSTSKYESSLGKDSNAVRLELESEVQSKVAEITSNTQTSPQNVVRITGAEIISLRAHNDRIEFGLLMEINDTDRTIQGDLKSHIYPDEELISCTNESDCKVTKIIYLNDIYKDKNSPIYELFSPLISAHSDISTLEMSLELSSKLKALSRATDGFPSEISGNFGRMLYLSVVTITTLGYGDIVPISDFNRFLVGFESFLGLVIIGLFLNSLAHEKNYKL